MNALKRIATVIRDFDYGDYGLDDLSYAIEADPDSQEWIPALAAEIAAALDRSDAEAAS